MKPPKVKPKQKQTYFGRRVQCLETGRIFRSARVASDFLGVHKTGVSRQMRRGQKCQGFTFKFIDP